MARKIVVVTDADSGHEAIYVDGSLNFSDETVYACDIACVAGSEAITFAHRSVRMPKGWEVFPDLERSLPDETMFG